MPDQLSNLLAHYLERTNRIFTPGLLSKLSGVPKTTIINWLTGRVARPRRWQDVAKVADALRLDEPDTNALLRAAGHPPLADLAAQTADPADSALLGTWIKRQFVAPAIIQPRGVALPTLPTALIGREHERAGIRALLERHDVRLLTLTGTGGTGKTRLALQVASDMQAMFAHGVAYVMLAAISDASMVAETIMDTLGIQTEGGQSPPSQLHAALRSKQMLLVLDNFEHVASAAPLLAELLAAAPEIKVFVTSRVVLHVYGEHVFAVPPLPLPDLDRLPSLPELTTFPSIALFVERAQASDPSFQLTNANARTIAEICVRLDGLPLSIELAAARIKVLAPHTLLARLATRLGILTWGARDLPARHQTLRATLDWSYRLLSAPTQQLFARLAVFSGTFDLDAAEAICGDEALVKHDAVLDWSSLTPPPDNLQTPSVLDELMALVDSSLIQNVAIDDGEHRFRMLETIREYAQEWLAARDEQVSVQQRFAAYYLALAEAAEAALMGAQQHRWLPLLEHEHDNLRAALGSLLGQGNVEHAARLAAALRPFWMIRGYLGEGRRWFDTILSRRAEIGEQVLAKAVLAAGRLARQQSDLAHAAALLHEGLRLHQKLGDVSGTAAVLGYLGVVAYDQGDFAAARTLHERSLALRQNTNDTWGVAATLANLGEVTRQQGDLDQAMAFHEQSLALFQQLGDQWGSAAALTNLATIARDRGEYDRAQRLFLDSAEYWRQLNDPAGLAECVEGLACVAVVSGDSQRAVRLAGAANAARQAIGAPLSPADHARYEQYLVLARKELPDAVYDQAWDQGQAMTVEQAVDLVQPR